MYDAWDTGAQATKRETQRAEGRQVHACVGVCTFGHEKKLLRNLTSVRKIQSLCNAPARQISVQQLLAKMSTYNDRHSASLHLPI